MTIGISEEHEELRQSVRRWLESRCPASVPRALLDAPSAEVPAFWSELADQGWLGLHLPEALGGQGFSMSELAVVVEEMGRAMAPGPFVPTVLASAVVSAGATDPGRRALLPGLADGTTVGSVALGPGSLAAERQGHDLVLCGSLRPVLGGASADLVVVEARIVGQASSSGRGTDAGEVAGRDRIWCVVDASDLEVTLLQSLDPTRPVAAVTAERVLVGSDRQLTGIATSEVWDIAAAVVASECCGLLGWCLDTASAYAKVREQFGRPIGQFQAVKHRLADMLVTSEQAAATTWDAAQVPLASPEAPLSAAVAAAIAVDGAVEASKGCVQVLGGIGFTWEHDAHMYLKRSVSLRQLVGGSRGWRRRVAELALGGARRSLAAELLAALPPEESERCRAEVAGDIAALKALERGERRKDLAERGYLAPHWPEPWGRGAGAVEQLVIDEELGRAGIRRPHLAVGAWALPTIIAHGTPEQQERWVRPTLLGELTWCQMFSEPGAGSDLASLITKAVKVKGGWRLSGQKVWTSMAAQADLAICLARTDPGAPKHEGITYFILDVRAEGIDVRPLRELTGHAMFNEVFLSDVFVADDCVVGKVNDGWRLARTTLANERVSMSSGSSFGGGVDGLLELVAARPDVCDAAVVQSVGSAVAEAQSLALLGHRATLRTLSGVEPGAESSVRKLLGVEHEQRVQELGLDLLGGEGTTTEGDAARWTFGFLANRCLTIAGGTSEVQRNLIAERLLGLPRDPEPGS
jgi:alkylation response protein AidB-like acyl-CoA dehydrogenase